MFGVSLLELLLILLVVLVVFGPDKLPEMARTIGKFSGTLRKSSDALRREFYNAVYTPDNEIAKDLRETGRELRSIQNEVATDIREAAPMEIPEKFLTTCEDQARAEREEAERAAETLAESEKVSSPENTDKHAEKGAGGEPEGSA